MSQNMSLQNHQSTKECINGGNEEQDGLKIAGGNTNNLRHADDTTLMAESKKGLLRKMKRRVKMLA